MKQEWNNFKGGQWTKNIDVRNFIQANYTPYESDASFLAGATEDTKTLGRSKCFICEGKRKWRSFRC